MRIENKLGIVWIIRNFGYEYIFALAKGFYGIENVECVKAEGLDIYGADVEDIMAKAKKTIDLLRLC